jgi:hypothetical protein
MRMPPTINSAATPRLKVDSAMPRIDASELNPSDIGIVILVTVAFPEVVVVAIVVVGAGGTATVVEVRDMTSMLTPESIPPRLYNPLRLLMTMLTTPIAVTRPGRPRPVGG